MVAFAGVMGLVQAVTGQSAYCPLNLILDKPARTTIGWVLFGWGMKEG